MPLQGSPYRTEVQAINCAFGSEQDDLGSLCECLPGWEKEILDPATGTYRCVRCLDGNYKGTKGNDVGCDMCPFREDTAGNEGSTSKDDCKCIAGMYDIRSPSVF